MKEINLKPASLLYHKIKHDYIHFVILYANCSSLKMKNSLSCTEKKSGTVYEAMDHTAKCTFFYNYFFNEYNNEMCEIFVIYNLLRTEEYVVSTL